MLRLIMLIESGMPGMRAGPVFIEQGMGVISVALVHT